jgi:putative FmdB family regulatory protein
LPTYEYACTACGHRLEAVQSFSDDPLTQCPECGGVLRKVYGAVGIVLKGSGFYRNDSRAASGANGSGAKSAKSQESSNGDSPSSDSTPKKETATGAGNSGGGDSGAGDSGAGDSGAGDSGKGKGKGAKPATTTAG